MFRATAQVNLELLYLISMRHRSTLHVFRDGLVAAMASSKIWFYGVLCFECCISAPSLQVVEFWVQMSVMSFSSLAEYQEHKLNMPGVG